MVTATQPFIAIKGNNAVGILEKKDGMWYYFSKYYIKRNMYGK